MEKKTGILVVSFGTSFRDSFEKNILAVENAIRDAFPGRELRRAFTSGMIIKKLRTRDGFAVPTVREALDGFLADGFTDLLVQPTHIINGHENDEMLSILASYREKFRSIRTGAPLLTGEEDYRTLIHALADEYAGLKDEEALVLMGHGTGHHGNAAYPALNYMLKAEGYSRIHVGTIEGYPDLELVKKQVDIQRPKKVILAPLMLVAGDHASNDMAGDDENSWKNRFLRDGYEVECILKGLGEYPAVRDLFATHAKEAKPL